MPALRARSLLRRFFRSLPNFSRVSTVASGSLPLLSGGRLRMSVELRPTVSRYIWKRRSAGSGDSPS